MDRRLYILAVLLAVAGLAGGACGDLSSECASATVSPARLCNNDGLQCPYSLDQPNCDGTFSSVATSCVCQHGAWSCPSAVACEAATNDGGGDDGAADDAASDVSVDDAQADGAPVDDGAASDAPLDVASDVSCISPEIPCSGVCVNPLLDKNNCGYCGHKCLGNHTCSGGTCI
jgi:hypothetical protein